MLGGDSADTLIVSARDARWASACSWSTRLTSGATPTRCRTDARRRRAPDRRARAAPRHRGRRARHISTVIDIATAALCAEAVGACERMLWMTVEYLKTRVQFGRRSRCSRRCSSARRTCTSRSSRRGRWRCWPGCRSRTTTLPSGGSAVACGQDPGRPVQSADRAGGDPAARRHRDDDGVSGRPLLQAQRCHRARPSPTPASWSSSSAPTAGSSASGATFSLMSSPATPAAAVPPAPAELPPVYYLPLGDGRFEPTDATTSPWDASAQHGGPPTALLATCLDDAFGRAGLRVARISMDFLGPVPRTRLRVETRLIRPGKRTQLSEATMWGGRPGGSHGAGVASGRDRARLGGRRVQRGRRVWHVRRGRRQG